MQWGHACEFYRASSERHANEDRGLRSKSRRGSRRVDFSFADLHIAPGSLPMKQAASHSVLARVNAHSSRASAAGESHDAAHAPFGDTAFAAVFETSAEALLVVDAKGIIQRANLRASEMLHRQGSELLHAELGKFLMRPSSEEFSRLCALQAGFSAPSMAEGGW
jgi:PAS domain-containing protein